MFYDIYIARRMPYKKAQNRAEIKNLKSLDVYYIGQIERNNGQLGISELSGFADLSAARQV